MGHTRNLRVRVQVYLPQLRTREITNREVAEALGVNEQYLSRTLAELDFKKEPAPDRAAQKAANKARKERIRELANSGLTPEQAAKEAGVSLRTIYRYIDTA